MTAKSVEAHIGRCLAESESATQSTSILSKPSFPSSQPAKRPDRLPVVNFSLIKDQALKKKLVDLGISAAGGKEMMRKRLTEYTTIWNANCDAKHPRGTSQLKRDLESWERTLGSRAPQPSPLSAHIKDKDFDGLAWGEQHKDSFNDLIAKARQKVTNKSAKKSEESSSAYTTVPSSSSQITLDVASSGEAVKGQENELVEIQGDRTNAEVNSIPSPSILPRASISKASEANNPTLPGRLFAERSEQLPEYSMAVPPSSQFEQNLPIVQVQEVQDAVASTDLNKRPLQQ